MNLTVPGFQKSSHAIFKHNLIAGLNKKSPDKSGLFLK